MVFIIKIMASIIYNILCLYICYSFIVIVIFYSLYAQVPRNFLYACYVNKHKQYEHNKNHELCSS